MNLPAFTLDQYAATTCPVKTQNTFNPLIGDRCEIDTDFVEHFRETSPHRDHVLRAIIRAHRDTVRDLRTLVDGVQPSTACIEAMNAGVPIILSAEMPPDLEEHRRGLVDVLFRGEDENGHLVYYPAIIKDHLVLAPTQHNHEDQVVASIPKPFLNQATHTTQRFRVESRSFDLLQLAHLWELVRAAGFGSAQAWGAIIGTDHLKKKAGHCVVWVNLDVKQIRVFSYTSSHQWKRHSPRSRYQHEHRFRVRVVKRAMQQTGSNQDPELAAAPVRVPQCEMCEWWPICKSLLIDDISVRIERSPLDARETMTLRGFGIKTITDLAACDIDALLPGYLPQVAHRSGAETRLRLAAHRGRLLAAGLRLERLTSGPIDLPQASVEIDLDIETSAQNRVYLWGFLVHDHRSNDVPPAYHPVRRFSSLTPTQELNLAEEAATWLQEFVASLGEDSVLVWHYSTYETSALRRLHRSSVGSTLPGLTWLTHFAERHFVDLLPVVKKHFFGVDGLGLKAVATTGAGFSWRDSDPHGLNSQYWFADAIFSSTAEEREAARTRILEYNEDDVRATWSLRQWLRSLT